MDKLTFTFPDIHGNLHTTDGTGNNAYNADCMEFLKSCPDKFFDLAIVDPPYGDGQQLSREREPYNRFGGWFDRYKTAASLPRRGQVEQVPAAIGQRECSAKKIIAWDTAPQQEYFDELFRVSRNQIIWGGNYFYLPPTRCFLVWRKLTISEKFSMAMAEYAWTSFNSNAKVFECAPQGKKNDPRFHPTQKPIALYEWVIGRYAKQGDKLLDTHMGSGSSRIAAHRLGFDYVGLEIDEGYFQKEQERFERMTEEPPLFKE